MRGATWTPRPRVSRPAHRFLGADPSAPSGAVAGPLLAELFEHEDFVRRVARTLVADPSSADDLVQETWLTALRRPPRHRGALRGWLSQVVRSHALNRFESERRRTLREEQAQRRGFAASPEEIATERSVSHHLAAAIDSLREPYREAVLLRHYEGLAPREIAARLDVPVETVRTRLKRGHAFLRERLDQEYGGERSAWNAALLALPALGRREAALPAPLYWAVGIAVLSAPVAFVVWWAGRSAEIDPLEVAGRGSASTAVAPAADGERTVIGTTASSIDPTRSVTTGPSVATRPVFGRVVDVDGSAIAGARVFLWTPDRPDVARDVATADAEGEYKVAAAPVDAWIGARRGELRISELRHLDGPGDRARGRLERDLVLSATRVPIEGTVRDSEGRPVAGARVAFDGATAYPPRVLLDGGLRLRPPATAATTDDRGAFRIVAANPRRSELVVAAEGFGVWRGRVSDGALDVRLFPEREGRSDGVGRIDGVALDSDERPLAGWTVELEAEDAILAHHSTTLVADRVARWRAITDASGRFAFPALLDRSYLARLVEPGDVARGVPSAWRRGVRPEDGRELVLLVSPDGLPTASLYGTLNDADGVPATDTEVLVSSDLLPRQLRVPVDGATGHFEVRGLCPGSYSIGAWAHGSPPRTIDHAELLARQPYDLGTLHLDSPGSLRVHVAYGGGIPPGSFSVALLSPPDLSLSSESAMGREGIAFEPEGVAVVEALPPGRYELVVKAPGSMRATRWVEVAAGEELDVELALERGVPARVEVVCPASAGHFSQLVVTVRDAEGGVVAEESRAYSGSGEQRFTITVVLADGEYAVAAEVVGRDLVGSATLAVRDGGAASTVVRVGADGGR